MSADLLWHRIQFGFTITCHYLFPQLTTRLALLIVRWWDEVWPELLKRARRERRMLVFEDESGFYLLVQSFFAQAGLTLEKT